MMQYRRKEQFEICVIKFYLKQVSKLGKLKAKDENHSVQDVKADDLRQMFLAMTEEVYYSLIRIPGVFMSLHYWVWWSTNGIPGPCYNCQIGRQITQHADSISHASTKAGGSSLLFFLVSLIFDHILDIVYYIQASIAMETLQVFAPLAKLLGIYQIKVSNLFCSSYNTFQMYVFVLSKIKGIAYVTLTILELVWIYGGICDAYKIINILFCYSN